MTLAPIALFTYNRLWHTQQTVAALRKNELASESDLYVFCDGPKRDTDREKVQAVREYVRSIDGFRNVIVIERERNFGLAQSIITGVTEVVSTHGRIIVVEDDLVTSPYFLRFMNDGLEFYRDEERVISIHGYVYPVEATLPELFFIKGADCWGWATWKRGWELFERDGNKLLHQLKSRSLTDSFDFDDSYPYTKMLEDQVNRKNDSWAIRWYASAFLKEKLTLYPGKSLVANIGNDGSGTHSGTTDVFTTTVSNAPLAITAIAVEENLPSKRAFTRYFVTLKPSIARRAIGYIYNTLRRRASTR